MNKESKKSLSKSGSMVEIKSSTPKLIIGIDATNVRDGGGLTYILELLTTIVPANHGISKIVIWGSSQTLAKLPYIAWLKKENPPALNKGLFVRTFWQRFKLSHAARKSQCDVLFIPGGSYKGTFKPIVAMSQNLLPFERSELNRFGISLIWFKLNILRYTQSHSFRFADGVIFLTEYAKQAVLKVTGPLSGDTIVIAHGLSSRFRMRLKAQRPIGDYTESNPYRLLYVSSIYPYKHQWHLIEAVHILRTQGLPIKLDLIGPAFPATLPRLKATIAKFDPEKIWVQYHGAIPYETLNNFYAQSDLGVFASSCENMPIILLEAMASALPIACSNCGPMPEILGDSGLYFDPENPLEIAQSLRMYIDSPELRNEKAKASVERCQKYTWERCAEETFAFLSKVGRK
jgi:glycosyltransferase involved in cell wall biosynthesis